MRWQRGAGAALLILGGAVMLGWFARIAPAVRLQPEFAPMVFNSALCFALAGAALLSPPGRAALALGGAVTLIAGTLLVQHLAGADFGLDWPALHAWTSDAGKVPGRMVPGVSTGFLLAGLALLLAGRKSGGPAQAGALRLLALGVATVGALVVAGYAVGAADLFPAYAFAGVALHTALGMLVLSAGLGAAARRFAPPWLSRLAREDDRIALVGASVLAVVAAVAGLATFAVLQEQVVALARANVLAAQATRAETFVDFIAAREASARIAATRPAALRNIRAIQAGRDPDRAHLANLEAVVQSFVKEGFSGIAYLDANGRTAASGGEFAQAPALVAPLATPSGAELLWSGGFLLRHRIPLRDAEGEVGSLLAEQPMPVLTRMAGNLQSLGETGDVGVCFRDEQRLRCFPQRLNPRAFAAPLVNADGQPLPMTRALRGQSGTTITRDYRAQAVVAAYGPVGDLGIGIVVKVDTTEIFAPVRELLLPAALMVLLLAAGGALLLRARVKPLAARLVNLNQDLRGRSAELESANRELEAFSYSVSHDLRAPLRHIAGFAAMLKEDCAAALDKEGRRYVDTIAEAAARMGALIDDLLSFSRMGRVDMHRDRVSMTELVQEAVAGLAHDTQQRDVEWQVGELPEVQGDRSLLRQVWVNLLANAVKYTRKREVARISVSARLEGGEHVFCVKDNGAGFDMDYAGKLFGVFQRLHRQEEFEGTGIGLANVRRIVARHGGRTWAEGKEDVGARIFFTLPAVNRSAT